MGNHYEYRLISNYKEITDRINEARVRGWRIHTFVLGDVENDTVVLFERHRWGRNWQTPFADDEQEEDGGSHD